MSLLTLYIEAVRALLRGKMALFGLATLLGLLALLASQIGLTSHGLNFFLIIAYIVVPSGLSAVAALQIASPRATKFVQAVFTAPVRRSSYFWANVLASWTAGLAYLAMTLPFLAVHMVYVGVPDAYVRFLGVGVFLSIFGTGFGTMVGVLFPGRSVAPAATLATLPLALLLLMPLPSAFAETDPLPREHRLLLQVAHASPQLNAMEALNATVADSGNGPVPKHRMRMAVVFGLSTIALFSLAAWTYLRWQGVEDWEVPGGKQALVALVFVALVLAPALTPGAARYGTWEGPDDSWRWWSGHESVAAYVTRPGTEASTGGIFGHAWSTVWTVGAWNAMEVLLVFEVGLRSNVTQATVEVRPGPGLRLEGDARLEASADRFERAEDMFNGGPFARFQALRIPVNVFVAQTSALAESDHWLNVTLNYTVSSPPAGEDSTYGLFGPRDGSAVASLEPWFMASVPNAALWTGAGMGALPVAFLVLGVVRAVRRR